ncbi:MAG: response regulator [Planctomycetaceae bacterium]|jgi:signal transduction histidine kinase/ActR/RegA family two-component response regulator|nr:response regulator [Planctomycetaceae bacterium]
MPLQARLIGYDYSVYYDLIAVTVFLFLCMGICSAWLRLRKCSVKFLLTAWTGFLLLVLPGTAGMVISIHTQRLHWRDAFAKIVTAYADVIMQFDYQRIHSGNPELFSDWSPAAPVAPPLQDTIDPIPDADTRTEKSVLPAVLTGKLKTPAGLAAVRQVLEEHPKELRHHHRRNQWAVAALTGDSYAYDRCTEQIAVKWNPVEEATTYRLQWKHLHNGSNSDWFDAYSGSEPYCELAVPGNLPLAVRVRAENGTPENDPLFTQLINVCNYPVETNIYAGYAYTMRRKQEQYQFIISPIADADHNGVIDFAEKPASIGENYPATPLMDYVWEHQEMAMSFQIIPDKWGKWFTIMEPLRTKDKTIDGVFAIDFHVDRVHSQMFRERIYPNILFVLAVFFYFGAVLFINRLQIEKNEQQTLADQLQQTVLDLTEAKRAAEQALHTKTLFLTNMSHELRTPLNAMLGFTEIIGLKIAKSDVLEKAEYSDAICQVKENGKDLLALIDNILGAAAMDEHPSMRLQFVPVNLRELMADVAGTMRSKAETKGLKFSVSEPKALPDEIWNDPDRLRQVVVPLISNAVKFTDKGEITINYGLYNIPEERPVPSASRKEQMFFVSVRDTGIGIAEEHLSMIFRPFTQSDPSLTRQYGGAGLGLSVARQTAELLKGQITVESIFGKGSTFTFIFPAQTVSNTGSSSELVPVPDLSAALSTEPAGHKNQPSLSPSLPLAGRKILVVDDTKVNQIVIAAQLKQAGAEVETADNGQIGIDKITEQKKNGKPFDVILMDMQMPVLDGYDATRQLRAEGYTLPIIAVTAHALPEDRQKTLDAGCDEYVTKPVDYDRLFGVMLSCLQGRNIV